VICSVFLVIYIVAFSEDSRPEFPTEVNKYTDLIWGKIVNEFEYHLKMTVF
jgi:hypothetical protein